MQTFTIQVTDNNGLKAIQALEDKHFIRIVGNTKFDSPAFPGQPMSLRAFQKWIHSAEDSSTVTLKEAKGKWANKRKQLQKFTR